MDIGLIVYDFDSKISGPRQKIYCLAWGNGINTLLMSNIFH